MRWAGHAKIMEEKRNAYNVLVRKTGERQTWKRSTWMFYVV
jgi:hypothetical protein